ncbi:hypothetical protein [Streptomonospora alba]|uniref:hypothetical protein n=1 Tax=Streptomonospora alba TaxID=183763 RepID=UPI0012EE5B9B|nr:hypothetical protein [Streptomonospora alba]
MTAGTVPIGPGEDPSAIILRLTHSPFPPGRAMTPREKPRAERVPQRRREALQELR